jgi:hypothetical protein
MRAVELAVDLEGWCCGEGGEGWIGFMAHEDFVWSLGYFLLTDEDSSHKYMKGKVSAVALLSIEIMNFTGKYKEDQGTENSWHAGAVWASRPID